MSDTRQQRPFTSAQANAVAAALERLGWRAEACVASFGVGFVEVRDLAYRWTPLVATLRTAADVDAFSAQHPEHGLIGRRRGCTGIRPPGMRSARPAY